MYPPVVAEQRRLRGHDAIGARAHAELAHRSDRDLLVIAADEQRVMVTENIRDFLDIDAEYRQTGRQHFGVILTTDHKYPRRHGAGIGRLVTALDAWLREHPEAATADSLIWWL
jgi:hypothetical protein